DQRGRRHLRWRHRRGEGAGVRGVRLRISRPPTLMAPKAAKDSVEQFAERYRVGQTDDTRAVERIVIGGDWGANGYTTMAQADRLAEVLDLRPGKVLLDVGSGRGWPGLYLSRR